MRSVSIFALLLVSACEMRHPAHPHTASVFDDDPTYTGDGPGSWADEFDECVKNPTYETCSGGRQHSSTPYSNTDDRGKFIIGWRMCEKEDAYCDLMLGLAEGAAKGPDRVGFGPGDLDVVVKRGVKLCQSGRFVTSTGYDRTEEVCQTTIRLVEDVDHGRDRAEVLAQFACFEQRVLSACQQVHAAPDEEKLSAARSKARDARHQRSASNEENRKERIRERNAEEARQAQSKAMLEEQDRAFASSLNMQMNALFGGAVYSTVTSQTAPTGAESSPPRTGAKDSTSSRAAPPGPYQISVKCAAQWKQWAQLCCNECKHGDCTTAPELPKHARASPACAGQD